jgi:serine/threonine protein kinase
VTFKFWEMLKIASEVTLVPEIIFFLKFLKFVQSFLECKVSLADGTSLVVSLQVHYVYICFLQRPWSELRDSYQIMFKVGMGGKPPFPPHLSREGKNFLSCCLQTDPSKRKLASQLLDHCFIKVCYFPVLNLMFFFFSM